MANPAFRWSRLFTITGLVIVTAGVAAAPFRDGWLPLVGRPLGLWNNSGGLAAPDAARSVLAARETVAPIGTLDAPFIAAPPRLDYRVGQAGTARSDAGSAVSNRDRDDWSSSSANGSRRAARAREVASSRWGGSVRGYGGGSRSAGAVERGGSYNRNNTSQPSERARETGRSAGNSSSSSSSSTSGRGSSDRKGSDDLFKEHKKGLPDLSGKDGGGFAFGKDAKGKGGKSIGGAPNLAATPEPSSMLLFGTGIAAVAGALRRRLRR